MTFFFFSLPPADERDAIQKKTFTKWVNKHLKKVSEDQLVCHGGGVNPRIRLAVRSLCSGINLEPGNSVVAAGVLQGRGGAWIAGGWRVGFPAPPVSLRGFFMAVLMIVEGLCFL